MTRLAKSLIVAGCFVVALFFAALDVAPKFGAVAWAAGFCDGCPDFDRAKLEQARDEVTAIIWRDTAILFIGLAGGIWWIVRKPNDDESLK